MKTLFLILISALLSLGISADTAYISGNFGVVFPDQLTGTAKVYNKSKFVKNVEYAIFEGQCIYIIENEKITNIWYYAGESYLDKNGLTWELADYY